MLNNMKFFNNSITMFLKTRHTIQVNFIQANNK